MHLSIPIRHRPRHSRDTMARSQGTPYPVHAADVQSSSLLCETTLCARLQEPGRAVTPSSLVHEESGSTHQPRPQPSASTARRGYIKAVRRPLQAKHHCSEVAACKALALRHNAHITAEVQLLHSWLRSQAAHHSSDHTWQLSGTALELTLTTQLAGRLRLWVPLPRWTSAAVGTPCCSIHSCRYAGQSAAAPCNIHIIDSMVRHSWQPRLQLWSLCLRSMSRALHGP